jgi:hypothetical protein
MLLSAPPLVQADSGSITGVKDVGGGQLEATFSAVGTDCTSYGFCGWYAYARQVPQTSACTVSNSDLIWVGDYHSASTSETETDRFYRKYVPAKLCLIVSGANGEQVVAETTWSPPALPPPSSIAPSGGARIRPQGHVTFTAAAQEAGMLVFEISESSQLDPDGSLADTHVVERGTALPKGYTGDTYEYESLETWSRRPGTYYWQAHRSSCPPQGCSANSEVRSLTILPPVLNLSVTARARQRLRSPARDRYNNLVTRLRCNLRCIVHMSGRAYYRIGGERRVLRGSRFTDIFTLPRARTQYFGFNFGARHRARLARVMARHGPLLWKFEYEAEAGASDPDYETTYIRMLPPRAPRAPSRPPSYPSPPVDCQGYSPCLPPGPDVDCSGGSGDGPRYVEGPVRVYGSDPYGLDADGNGVGCQ